MNKFLFLDIETRPTSNQEYIEKLRQDVRDKRPAHNMKREEKALWDDPSNAEERFQEAYRKTALDVLWAEILCIGVASDEGDPMIISALGQESCEEKLLAEFARLLEAFDSNMIIVGHNIRNFDLPIIRNRLVRHRIKPPAFFYDCKIFDTMLKTPCSNGLGLVSLNNACMSLGLGKAKQLEWNGEPMNGARVWDLYQAGEYDLLAEYCKRDVFCERNLFNALTFNGTVNLGREETVGILSEEIETLHITPTDPAQKYEILRSILQNSGIIKKAS